MANGPTSPEPAGHDAQRELEHRALRNVRGLLDRIQEDDERKQRSAKWLVGVLVAVVLAFGALFLGVVNRQAGSTKEIVVPPAQRAPARQVSVGDDGPMAGTRICIETRLQEKPWPNCSRST